MVCKSSGELANIFTEGGRGMLWGRKADKSEKWDGRIAKKMATTA